MAKLLTHKVSDRLLGFLLPHQERNPFVLFVSKELCVADATLLPLVITESVQFDSEFQDTLKSLFASFRLNNGKLNLTKCAKSVIFQHGISLNIEK